MRAALGIQTDFQSVFEWLGMPCRNSAWATWRDIPIWNGVRRCYPKRYRKNENWNGHFNTIWNLDWKIEKILTMVFVQRTVVN